MSASFEAALREQCQASGMRRLAAAAADPAKLQAEYDRGVAAERKRWTAGMNGVPHDLVRVAQTIGTAADKLCRLGDVKDIPANAVITKASDIPRRPEPVRVVNREPARVSTNGTLPKGERAVLTAVAQHDGGTDRAQLSVLTGYKRSSRDTYLQKLREKGLIETNGDEVLVTDSGIAALGPDFESLPTGLALRGHWLARLPEGERKVLEFLIGQYPDYVGRDMINKATGYKRSSRDTYLQKLSARKLVEVGRDGVRAAATLFD